MLADAQVLNVKRCIEHNFTFAQNQPWNVCIYLILETNLSRSLSCVHESECGFTSSLKKQTSK